MTKTLQGFFPASNWTSLRSQLIELYKWWRRELSDLATDIGDSLLPSRSWRAVLELNDSTSVLRVRNKKLTIEPISIATQSIVAESIVTGNQWSLPTSTNEFWPANYARRVRVNVTLPTAAVLVRKIVLPMVGDRDLANAIDLRIDRELPLARDQVYVDWVVTERDMQTRRITVAVAVARRNLVDRIRDSIESWGWTVTAISAAATDSQWFDFLNRKTVLSNDVLSSLDRALRWSACSLSLLLLCTIGGQWIYERQTASDVVSKATAQVETLAKRQSKITAVSAPIVQLRQFMELPNAAVVLTTLTESIPSDAWLYQLELQLPSDGSARIKFNGFAPSGTALVESLEQSPQFENVQLLSSHAAGMDANADRVEVSATWQQSTDVASKAEGT